MRLCKYECALPYIISDGMVLQRDKNAKIWGRAKVGSRIQVSFLGVSYSTRVKEVGSWDIELVDLIVGGPYLMQVSILHCNTVTIETEEVVIKDIFVGDVYLLGGQSNMEMRMKDILEHFEGELKVCEIPGVRQFEVPMRYEFMSEQNELMGGKWMTCEGENIREFSAVGYFFAKELYDRFKVPIGLVHTAVPGTPIEAWMQEDSLIGDPDYKKTIRECQESGFVEKINRQEELQRAQWFAALEMQEKRNHVENWMQPDYVDLEWSSLHLPGQWDTTELRQLCGAVWFRKDIEILHTVTEEGVLYLGSIIDADWVYVNGRLVGQTDYRYPRRKYKIPAGILKQGKNTLAIRVISKNGSGGFVKGKPYKFVVSGVSVTLEGKWKYKISAVMETACVEETLFQYKPIGLFNAMIYPLRKFVFCGVLWYQGESNTKQAKRYKQLFESMVNTWRDLFAYQEFPWLFVQLANYLDPVLTSRENGWAELRNQQRLALSMKHTAMVTTMDIGESNDLHPLNKQEVGRRLSLCARKLIYGQEFEYNGPLYVKAEIVNDTMELHFSNVASGFVVKGFGDLPFELCGEEGKFVQANYTILEDSIILYAQTINNPKVARYAWEDAPRGALLFNGEGLAASPFCTFMG